MHADRVTATEQALDQLLEALELPARVLAREVRVDPGSTLTAGRALEVFADQVLSRQLDIAARTLKASGHGYYTIASAGHEDNAVLGHLLAPTDPCFLHYRSGAFMMARLRHDPAADRVGDTLASFAAAAADPVAGGRHKVWGSRATWVVPQTSTVASQVPKAVGAAFALQRARRVSGASTPLPDDAIVCCSFGDASANHSTALGAINAARWSHRHGAPVPILLVCEDNGLGISVATPKGWIAASFAALPHLRYIRAAGDPSQVWAACEDAIAHCRQARAPVFLHLLTTRLWGHAGSDVEATYRTPAEIAATEAADPLLRSARWLVGVGAATPAQLRELVSEIRTEVAGRLDQARGLAPLASREEVVAPLARGQPQRWRATGSRRVGDGLRREHFGGELPEEAAAPSRRTLAGHLNAALHDLMLARPELLVFGEDVGRKGGVYHVTAGLQASFGTARVFDTLLDETTILGVAQGAGLLGMVAVPEIQYLAYLHNALDQLRGEACSTAFFSAGAFTNPIVVRIAGLAYQKGFGGHFHNDNAIGALRDIPGLALAVPSLAADGARLLRGAVAIAAESGRVVAFLEPIALYHEKDLHEPRDGGWLADYPPPDELLLPGQVGIHHADASDVLVVTYGNGVRMALQAARRLAGDHDVAARVLDLRWLAPLDLQAVRAHADACAAVLVADECRATGGGIADAVIAGLVECGWTGPIRSVRSADSYVPLGPAADHVLLSTEQIVAGALSLTTG